jgi:hypothetical protein
MWKSHSGRYFNSYNVELIEKLFPDITNLNNYQNHQFTNLFYSPSKSCYFKKQDNEYVQYCNRNRIQARDINGNVVTIFTSKIKKIK